MSQASKKQKLVGWDDILYSLRIPCSDSNYLTSPENFMMMNELDKLKMLTIVNLQDNFDRICSEVAKVWYVHKPWYQLASLELWACRGGVQQSGTQCGHAEGEFCSLELGVGMQRGSCQTGCGHAERKFSRTGCGHAEWEFDSIELGVGMQSWAGCGHAEGEFDSLELGMVMQRESLTVWNWVWAYRGGVIQSGTGCGHAVPKSSHICCVTKKVLPYYYYKCLRVKNLFQIKKGM